MLIKSGFLDTCVWIFIVLSTYNPTFGIFKFHLTFPYIVFSTFILVLYQTTTLIILALYPYLSAPIVPSHSQ